MIHHQRAGDGDIERGIVNGFDLHHALTFCEHLPGQTVHLRSQQIETADRMHESAQLFTAHLHPDQLRPLRTGCQKGVEILKIGRAHV